MASEERADALTASSTASSLAAARAVWRLPLPALDRVWLLFDRVPALLALINLATPLTLLVLLGVELHNRIVNLHTGTLLVLSNVINFRTSLLFWPLCAGLLTQVCILLHFGHVYEADFSSVFVIAACVHLAASGVTWFALRGLPAPKLSIPGLVVNHAVMTVSVLYQWMVLQNNRRLPCVSTRGSTYGTPCCTEGVHFETSASGSCIEDGWAIELPVDVSALFLLLFKNVNFLMGQTKSRAPRGTQAAQWALLAVAWALFLQVTLKGAAASRALVLALVLMLAGFLQIFLADGARGACGLFRRSDADAADVSAVDGPAGGSDARAATRGLGGTPVAGMGMSEQTPRA